MVTKKRFYRQLVAYALCVCMIFSLSAGFPVSALASDAWAENSGKQMTDISGHWAESQLNTWVNKGLVSGFPDETFRPNNSITRAEFMALVNRAYGFTEKAAISFSDVSKGDWFYDDVAKAVSAGYIVGYGDGMVGARNNISRQEAAAVIYRLMKLPEYSSKNAIETFTDYGSISAWSREAVNSVVAEGYMVGNPNGTFGPVNNITRAETVVTLSRATGEIYNAAGTYNQAGTIKGNATINTAGITLDGAVVEGNLYLTPGIGEGTVTLRNVTVKGTTVIAGGGKNSVILEDCELNEVIVARENGIVRVSVQGGTTIKIVVVEAGAILDSALLSEEGGILTVYVTADEAVELSGDFGTVHVENPGSVINVTGGSIENLIIAETAAGSSVNLSQTASVANMEINAPVTVTGQGTVENAVIGEGAKETTFEKEPINKEGPGSAAPSTPPGGSTGGGGGSSGGGTTVTKVNIAAIPGVTVPVTGQTPVSAITATAQYTGTVVWSPAHSSFEASTAYTATITLTAKSGYTLTGVAADFFTVAGATSVSNAANTGVITAVFPATEASGVDAPVSIVAVPGVTPPVTGQTPVSAITETAQYSGTVVWSPAHSSFEASTAYTATITLTAKSGYTLNGVAADSFTVAGATSVSNAADSGVITAVFPATAAPGPEKSVYDILFDPSGIVEGIAKEVAITLRAVEIKDEGYELVRINVSVAEQPSNSTVALIGNYGAGPVEVIALGYWGPETGHPVAANYDMSYDLMALFSKPGQYTLAVSLRDMTAGTDILTKNVTITVAEATAPTHTLTLTGENISSVPAAGAIAENTEVTITVSPAAGKQVAAFTVNGVNKKTELMAAPAHQYVFSITENTTVVVSYEDIPAGSTPPALSADTTANYAGQTLMITFSDGVTWANAITEIQVAGAVLSHENYVLNPGIVGGDGHITLYGSQITPLQSRGTKEIKVKSAGYTDAVVMQDITASYFDRAEFSTQPAGPAANGGVLTTQPTVSLYDQYDNLCIDGPASTREITLQAKTGSSWTLGGTVTVNAVAGVATFTGLTATNPGGLAINDARLMYEVVPITQVYQSADFTIPGATGLAAPTLTADTSDNYAGANIMITLPAGDWADWFDAITAVKVGTATLTSLEQYNIGANHLTLLTANITQLQTPGTYNITVEAAGYNNAVVSQPITAGPQANAQFTTQPLGPAVSGGQLAQQPVLTLYDTYNNVCADGPSGNASITLQRAVGDSWTLGGTNTVTAVNGVVTFTDLTATNPGGTAIPDARMGYTHAGLPNFTVYSESFIVPGLGSQTAPVLTADTSDNYAGNIIEITFADNPAWRAAVNSIIVIGSPNTQIFGAEGVTLETGKLVLDTSKIPALQERHYGHGISVAAPNYEATIVYQPITSGVAASISIDTQPQGPAANGGVFQTAPVISLSDAYNNQCIDGPSSGAAVTVEKIDSGDWILGGITSSEAYQGSVAFGLSAYNLTGTAITDAQLRFTVDGTALSVDSNTFTIPPGAAGGAPPEFTPDTDHNYIGYAHGGFTMTYPQNDDWTTQVINVGKVYLDGIELTMNDDYYLSVSGDTHYLSFYEPQNYFTEVRNYIIRIEAHGYTDAVIVQPITNGAPSSMVVDVQPGSPQESGELLDPQPVVKLYDADGNLCTVMRGLFPYGDSPEITASNHANGVEGQWYLTGTTSVAVTDGIAAFTNLRAASVDQNALTEGAQIVFNLGAINAVSGVFDIPPISHLLTLAASPAAGGTATIDGGGTSGRFAMGTEIAVTAAASQDYEFVNWTVGGTEVSDQASFTYTMPASDTTLVANFRSTLPQEPPTLIPNTTNNWAGFWIEIMFSDNDESYRDAITAIEVDGVEYTNTEGQTDIFKAYVYAIQLNTWNIPDLQSLGSHSITVKATGYHDAVVTQVITAGSIYGAECATISGPVHGETYTSGQPLPEIKLQLKDIFGNPLIDGLDAGIVLTNVEILGGFGGGCTLSGTLTAQADAAGQVTFNNIVVVLHESVPQASVALNFTGTNSLGYGFGIELTDPVTGDLIVFTVAEQP